MPKYIPSWEEFYPVIKQRNPNASDQEISDFYDQRYSGAEDHSGYMQFMQNTFGAAAPEATSFVKGLTAPISRVVGNLPVAPLPEDAGWVRQGTTGAANLLGMGATFLPWTRALQGAGLAIKAGGVLGNIGTAAANTAIAMGTYEGLRKPEEGETTMGNIASGAGMGAAFGTAGGVLEKIAGKYGPQAIRNAVTKREALAKMTPEQIKSLPPEQAMLPEDVGALKKLSYVQSPVIGAGVGLTEDADTWQGRLSNMASGALSFGLSHVATDAVMKTRPVNMIEKARQEQMLRKREQEIKDASIQEDSAQTDILQRYAPPPEATHYQTPLTKRTNTFTGYDTPEYTRMETRSVGDANAFGYSGSWTRPEAEDMWFNRPIGTGFSANVRPAPVEELGIYSPKYARPGIPGNQGVIPEGRPGRKPVEGTGEFPDEASSAGQVRPQPKAPSGSGGASAVEPPTGNHILDAHNKILGAAMDPNLTVREFKTVMNSQFSPRMKFAEGETKEAKKEQRVAFGNQIRRAIAETYGVDVPGEGELTREHAKIIRDAMRTSAGMSSEKVSVKTGSLKERIAETRKPKAEEEKIASVKMMITQKDKADLRNLGYTDDEIADMKPDKAGEILGAKTPKQTATAGTGKSVLDKGTALGNLMGTLKKDRSNLESVAWGVRKIFRETNGKKSDWKGDAERFLAKYTEGDAEGLQKDFGYMSSVEPKRKPLVTAEEQKKIDEEKAEKKEGFKKFIVRSTEGKFWNQKEWVDNIEDAKEYKSKGGGEWAKGEVKKKLGVDADVVPLDTLKLKQKFATPSPEKPETAREAELRAKLAELEKRASEELGTEAVAETKLPTGEVKKEKSPRADKFYVQTEDGMYLTKEDKWTKLESKARQFTKNGSDWKKQNPPATLKKGATLKVVPVKPKEGIKTEAGTGEAPPERIAELQKKLETLEKQVGGTEAKEVKEVKESKKSSVYMGKKYEYDPERKKWTDAENIIAPASIVPQLDKLAKPVKGATEKLSVKEKLRKKKETPPLPETKTPVVLTKTQGEEIPPAPPEEKMSFPKMKFVGGNVLKGAEHLSSEDQAAIIRRQMGVQTSEEKNEIASLEKMISNTKQKEVTPEKTKTVTTERIETVTPEVLEKESTALTKAAWEPDPEWLQLGKNNKFVKSPGDFSSSAGEDLPVYDRLMKVTEDYLSKEKYFKISDAALKEVADKKISPLEKRTKLFDLLKKDSLSPKEAIAAKALYDNLAEISGLKDNPERYKEIQKKREETEIQRNENKADEVFWKPDDLEADAKETEARKKRISDLLSKTAEEEPLTEKERKRLKELGVDPDNIFEAQLKNRGINADNPEVRQAVKDAIIASRKEFERTFGHGSWVVFNSRTTKEMTDAVKKEFTPKEWEAMSKTQKLNDPEVQGLYRGIQNGISVFEVALNTVDPQKAIGHEMGHGIKDLALRMAQATKNEKRIKLITSMSSEDFADGYQIYRDHRLSEKKGEPKSFSQQVKEVFRDLFDYFHRVYNNLRGRGKEIIKDVYKEGYEGEYRNSVQEEHVKVGEPVEAFRAIYGGRRVGEGDTGQVEGQFFALSPVFPNRFFQESVEANYGTPQYNPDLRMGRAKIDTIGFFDYRNPEHRSRFIEELYKRASRVQGNFIKDADKALDSYNAYMKKLAIKYDIDPDSKLVDIRVGEVASEPEIEKLFDLRADYKMYKEEAQDVYDSVDGFPNTKEGREALDKKMQKGDWGSIEALAQDYREAEGNALESIGFKGAFMTETLTNFLDTRTFKTLWVFDKNAVDYKPAGGDPERKVIKERPELQLKEKVAKVISDTFETPEENSRIAAIKAAFGTRESAKNTMKKHLESARTQLIDRLYPIQKHLGKLPYELHGMLENAHASMSVLLQHGKLKWEDKALSLLSDTKNEGFIPWMQTLGSDGRNFFYWLATKRGERLELSDREHWLTPDKRTEIQNEIFKNLTPEERRVKETQFEKWNKEFQEWNNNVLDIAKQSGLLSQEQINAWMKEYYVPFFRLKESPLTSDEFVSAPIKNRKNISAQIKRLTGGVDKLGDPIKNTMMNWTHLIQESQRNVARSAAADAAIKGKYAELLTKEEANALKGRGETGVITYQKDGKTVYLKVNDPDLFNAMTDVNVQVFESKTLKLLMGAKRLLTEGATFGPGFRIANALRDTIHSAIVSKNFVPFVDTVKGAIEVWKESPDALKLLASGGGFIKGYGESGDPKAMVRAIDKIVKREGSGAKSNILDTPKKLLAFWEKVGYASENAARVQLYKNLKMKGYSHLEAAYEAKDLLNFHRSGASGAVRLLASVTPFLNARVQGLDRLYRSATETPREFLRKGALTAAASLLLYSLHRKDERYRELEDWEKWQYHHFWIGDQHMRIPKAFEVGALFSSLVETASAVLDKDEEWDFFTRFVGYTLTETFAFGMPAAIGPSIESYANKSGFGRRPIETYGMQRMPAGERNYPWTPEMLKDLGKETNISPAKMEHIIRGHTATFGTIFLTLADAMYREATDAPSRPAPKAMDVLGLGRFARGETTKTKYAARYYDFAEKLDNLQATISNYRKLGDYEKAVKLTSEGRDTLKYKILVARVRERVRNLKRLEARVWADPNMSGSEKEKRLDDMNKESMEIFKDAYDRIYGN